MNNPYLVCSDRELRVLAEQRLRAERWDKLERLLSDVKFMEAMTGRLGVDTLLNYSGRALHILPEGDERHHRLAPVEQALDQEAHILRGWDMAARPVDFLQQMHKRASDLSVEALRTDVQTLLGERQAPYLALSWRAAGESSVVERTLAGHTLSVMAVAVTPDSRQIVSVAIDGTLKVWNVRTGQEVYSLHAHDDIVNDVAVTPDGRRIISAGDDGLIHVWDLETGGKMGTLHGHRKGVNAVAVTPDSRRAVSGCEDNTLKVWDLETYQEMFILGSLGARLRGLAVGDSITAVVITPEGRRVISGSFDGPLRAWDLDTGELLHKYRAEGEEGTQALATTLDGQRLISVTSPMAGQTRIWNLTTEEEERVLKHLWGYDVVITPNGRFILVISSDDLIIHDLDTDRRRKLGSLGILARGLAVTPDGRHAITGHSDGTLTVWDVESAEEALLASKPEERQLRGHGTGVGNLLITPDGRRGISISHDRMQLWDIEAGRALRTIRKAEQDFLSSWRKSGPILSFNAMTVLEGPCRFHTEGYGTFHWGADRGAPEITEGPRVLYYAGRGGVRILNPETGEDEFEVDVGPVTALAATPDGRRVVYGYSNGHLTVWDMETGLQEGTLNGHEREVFSVMLTRDGRWAVSISLRTMKVWDLRRDARGLRRKEVFTLTPFRPRVLTPNGHWLIGAWKDHTIRAWDLATGDVVWELQGHVRAPTALALTPDGRQLVSASRLGLLVVWNLQRGAVERVHRTGDEHVSAIAIAAQGNHLFTLAGHAVQAWDLESGQEVAAVSLEGALKRIAVASAGTIALIGDGRGNVYALQLVGAALGPRPMNDIARTG